MPPQGQLRSASSSESQLHMPQTTQVYGTPRQSETTAGVQRMIHSYRSGAIPLADVAAARNLLVTSSGPPSFQAPLEVATGKSRRLLFADSLQIASSDERIKSEGSQATSSNGKLSSF
ncbi:hypothetical protein BHE74_00053633 [Ensete ventricosum]|nr:hypothetical protein BHE74_00053633 [Ensete ventricosum]